jgi:hypothetical protein
VVLAADAASAGVSGDLIMVSDSGGIATAADVWTYLEEGVIESVFPTEGQAGTYVSVVGEELRGGGTEVVSATIAGVAAEVTSENSTHVVLRPGDAGASTGHVVLISDSGATVTAENAFTYATPGAIASVYPSVGQYNTRVTITGSALLGGGESYASITLGGVEASVVTANDTFVVVDAAASDDAGTGDAALVSDTGATVTLAGAFEYLTNCSISLASPARGQRGTYVTIRGSNLPCGGGSLVSLTLGGVEVAAASIVSEADDEFKVRAPEELHDFGVGDIVFKFDTGVEVVGENEWTFDRPSNITDACV